MTYISPKCLVSDFQNLVVQKWDLELEMSKSIVCQTVMLIVVLSYTTSFMYKVCGEVNPEISLFNPV